MMVERREATRFRRRTPSDFAARQQFVAQSGKRLPIKTPAAFAVRDGTQLPDPVRRNGLDRTEKHQDLGGGSLWIFDREHVPQAVKRDVLDLRQATREQIAGLGEHHVEFAQHHQIGALNLAQFAHPWIRVVIERAYEIHIVGGISC